MIGFVVHTAVSTVLLFMVGRMVSGIEVRDGKVALYGAMGLGLANTFVRPLLIKLTLPITFLTLGLFVWVVNATDVGARRGVRRRLRGQGVQSGPLGQRCPWSHELPGGDAPLTTTSHGPAGQPAVLL